MDALRSAPARSQVACGVSAPSTKHNTNILAPLVVEFPTSAAKDDEHLVVLRLQNILTSYSSSRCLLVLPVELCELWARSYEPEKGAEGNSVRTIQVVIVRTIFGAVRDIEFFQRRGLSRDYLVKDVSRDLMAIC